ncbi:MAG: hypothetical protein FWF59_04970 [Turicibacter sp.]|nr:hypothetical protein [Turicibacter sp.]
MKKEAQTKEVKEYPNPDSPFFQSPNEIKQKEQPQGEQEPKILMGNGKAGRIKEKGAPKESGNGLKEMPADKFLSLADDDRYPKKQGSQKNQVQNHPHSPSPFYFMQKPSGLLGSGFKILSNPARLKKLTVPVDFFQRVPYNIPTGTI